MGASKCMKFVRVQLKFHCFWNKLTDINVLIVTEEYSWKLIFQVSKSYIITIFVPYLFRDFFLLLMKLMAKIKTKLKIFQFHLDSFYRKINYLGQICVFFWFRWCIIHLLKVTLKILSSYSTCLLGQNSFGFDPWAQLLYFCLFLTCLPAQLFYNNHAILTWKVIVSVKFGQNLAYYGSIQGLYP